MNDRFGIGWRPELAAGILSNLDCIDIVEVIADDYFDRAEIKTPRAKHPGAPSAGCAARRHAWHGVSRTGRSKRLERTARLVEEIQPGILVGTLGLCQRRWTRDRPSRRSAANSRND